jgi:uncharacterized protein YbaR (Trm112 family)
MALTQDLLEILACPKCHGELEYRAKEDRLLCAKCRLAYAVKDDVPVMLVDEAKAY